MWEKMVLATGYQASLVTLLANEALTWLAQQLGGVIKMDFGPVRNLDVMVSLHKIELILCKPELKKSNQTKARILILDPFKSSAWKFLDTFTKAFENNHISATETNDKVSWWIFLVFLVATCPMLSLPTNGVFLGCNTNTTEIWHGTECSFSCKEGSVATGSRGMRCAENGNWTETDLECKGIRDLATLGIMKT